LVAQQDWKTLYQTFRDADFQSYDFNTLRKGMIDYIRSYYPEDFNDFIESSEYIALIDLIAFLGQSLAFRTDINARENFIDTAERRDSILKLARLISYNPKRNIGATGYLKIDSVTTTETVTDSNGLNLSNLLISWDDSANDMWLEQFTAIMDAALIGSQVIGKPGNSQVINGIQTDEYTVRLIPGITPTFRFSSTVDGAKMNFEAASATSANKTFIYEKTPTQSGNFNLLYRNDNLGNSSRNTGFFVYFKQGVLGNQDFSVTDSLPNRVININFDNINNNDVWLYKLDSAGVETAEWQQVPAVAGVNVLYNDIADRDLYQVATRANDQIDLVFGDGAFTNIPQGYSHLQLRVYGRGTFNNGGFNDSLYMTLNGDSGSNYGYKHTLIGNGASASSANGGTGTGVSLYSVFADAGSIANAYGVAIVDIYDYSSHRKWKTLKAMGGSDNNGTANYGAVAHVSTTWISNSPISTIVVGTDGNFAGYSHIALYGIA